MKKYKEKELIIDDIYNDREGYYIFKGKENGFYIFDEVYIDENEDLEIVQQLKRTAEELYFF